MLASTLAALAFTAPLHAPPKPCQAKEIRHYIRSVYHQTPRLSNRDSVRITRRVRCLPRDERPDLRRYQAKWRAWRRSYRPSWRFRWRRLPQVGRSWTESTSHCESYNKVRNTHAEMARTDTGNGFTGAFQWVPRTWYSAGGDRPVISATWAHQAVLAWHWHLGHPSGQWPVCGE